LSETIQRRQFKLKENHVVQVKILSRGDLEWGDCHKWCDENNDSNFDWDKYFEYILNNFCANHDILDIEPIAQIRSSSHEPSWRVHVTETYSIAPLYNIYYQIPKVNKN